MDMKRKHIASGFTLVEVLVVVVILGLLAALGIPAIGRALDRANLVKCTSNLRQIGMATLLYADEHGNYPVSFETGNGPNNNWQIALTPYISESAEERRKLFRCPAAKLKTGDSHYSLNQNVFYDPGSSATQIMDPKRPVNLRRPMETILIIDGLQNSAGSAQGGLTQFRGSTGQGQADVVTNPHQNQAADGAAGGGFPSYRHEVRSTTDRSANAFFGDGHVATVKMGTIKNRNLVITY